MYNTRSPQVDMSHNFSFNQSVNQKILLTCAQKLTGIQIVYNNLLFFSALTVNPSSYVINGTVMMHQNKHSVSITINMLTLPVEGKQ